MPKIKPFKALHPNERNAKHFPSKTIENYSQEEIQKKIDQIYDSIFQIIAPTFNAEKTHQENYKDVRLNFEESISSRKIQQDNQLAFYVYQQKSESYKYRGIIALFDIRDIEKGELRLHENTLHQRKQLFADYLSEVHIQSEPVLITYPTNPKIELFMDKAMNSKPVLKYADEDEVEHTVWKMDNRLNMKNYIETFDKMEALYIADGHHRLGSSEMYMENRKAQDKEYIGNEPYHYVLGYAVGSQELDIFEYNRLVKDLNGLSKEEFLEKLSNNFTIVEKGDQVYFPSHKHHISMYLEGEFYGLYIDHSLRGKPEGLGELDTYLFEQLVSKPILDIQDSSHDDRVGFIKGTGDKEGIKAMKEKVDSGSYKVGFGFYPIQIHDLKLIADLELKMPPKSTYIRPKLLTGLLMYNMKP